MTSRRHSVTRTRHPAPWRQSEPWRMTWRDNVRTVVEILLGLFVIAEIVVAVFLWSWIAAASRVTP
ncbi:MAG TPA: hypothetical protein VEW95_05395 [Candidatus Limnocylindrales bacterium]|nr:hypothetical protein [Candidatus Limnocylindrales bacterium]